MQLHSNKTSVKTGRGQIACRPQGCCRWHTYIAMLSKETWSHKTSPPKLAHGLRAGVSLPEDVGSKPSSHMASHNYCNSRIWCPFLASIDTVYMWYMGIHAWKTPIHVNYGFRLAFKVMMVSASWQQPNTGWILKLWFHTKKSIKKKIIFNLFYFMLIEI